MRMRLKSKPSQKKKFTANPRTKRDVLFLKKKKRDVLFKDRTDDRWVQRGAGPRAVTRIEEARPSPRTRTQETRQTDSGLQVGPRRKRPNNRSHLATARGTRFPARLSPSPWEPASPSPSPYGHRNQFLSIASQPFLSIPSSFGVADHMRPVRLHSRGKTTSRTG